MERGTLVEFMVCKFSLALVALALVGAVLGTASGFSRTLEQAELKQVVEEVAQTLWAVDGVPLELKLSRELPVVSRDFKLILMGNWDKRQTLLISAGDEVKKLELGSKVNGGYFRLELKNPRKLSLIKGEEIELRLS